MPPPPPLPAPVTYHGDDLCLDGQPLAALAARHGTPLYVYSRTAMLEALNAYQRALAGRDHLICYAVKANPSLAVLQALARAGSGFDIVSVGELERVLAVGVAGAKIVFSGVGKTRADMRRALEAGVLCFNVESVAELELLSRVAVENGRTADISLRVNPDVDARTHPYISTGLKDNKFGIAHREAEAVYLRAAQLPGLRITGIDCHIGSQITAIEPYLDALDRLLDLLEALEARGLVIPHLDLGGGLGVRYRDEAPPSIANFLARLLARIDARGHGHRRLLLEPGRSIVADAGVLLTEVVHVKPGVDAEAKNFCIVDAAMNDLLRPAMYGAWMNIVPCRRRDDRTPMRFDVVGPVCESSDWLGRDRDLAVAAGDLLAVLSAGAYAMSMASNYNSRGRPAEVLVAGAEAWLIREREEPRELFRSERLPDDQR